MPLLNCVAHSATNCFVMMKDPTFNASPSLESNWKMGYDDLSYTMLCCKISILFWILCEHSVIKHKENNKYTLNSKHSKNFIHSLYFHHVRAGPRFFFFFCGEANPQGRAGPRSKSLRPWPRPLTREKLSN